MMIERGWDYSVFPNNGIEPQYQIGAANKNNTTSTSSATKTSFSLGLVEQITVIKINTY